MRVGPNTRRGLFPPIFGGHVTQSQWHQPWLHSPRGQTVCRPQAGLWLLPFLLCALSHQGHYCGLAVAFHTSLLFFYFYAFLTSFISPIYPILSLYPIFLSSLSIFCFCLYFLSLSPLVFIVLFSFSLLFSLLPLFFLFLCSLSSCVRNVHGNQSSYLLSSPFRTPHRIIAVLTFLKLYSKITPCSELMVAPLLFWAECLKQIQICLLLHLKRICQADLLRVPFPWPGRRKEFMPLPALCLGSCPSWTALCPIFPSLSLLSPLGSDTISQVIPFFCCLPITMSFFHDQAASLVFKSSIFKFEFLYCYTFLLSVSCGLFASSSQ